MADREIEPVFMTQRDVRMPDATPFLICDSVSKIVGERNVTGAQNIRNQGLWYIYLKDKASRIKLLAKREEIVSGR